MASAPGAWLANVTADSQACLWLDAFLEWIESGACVVQDRDSGRMVSLGKAIKAPQLALINRMREQARHDEPIRIIVPKARKEGLSTVIEALGYFLCSAIPSYSAAAAAHSTDGTAALWKLTQRIRDHDPNGHLAQVSGRKIRWPNGSIFVTHTGAGFEIGRADTIYFLHISELGLWQVGKQQDQDRDSLTAIVNAVPKHQPNTIIIYESTGQGPAGEFYKMCKEADRLGSNKLLFLPWFADKRYRLAAPAEFEATKEEQELQRRHDLDLDQLAWRRATLTDPTDFSGREIDFHREFPSTLQECFEAAEGRVHPAFSREAHIRPFEWDPKEVLGTYRAIDWGWRDPFVCLWLVHYPGPPGFSIDPSCRQLIDEMFAYRRDAKSHDPLHESSHGPHSVRYGVTTFELRHHVHVYREMYAPDQAGTDRTPLTLCEDVHRLSGWAEVAPHRWEIGEKGEAFTASVADRSRPDSIALFSGHDLPCIGQVNLSTRKEGVGAAQKAEVEQGIDRVNELLVATVPLRPEARPLTALEKMEREIQGRRPFPIPVAEPLAIRALREEAGIKVRKRFRPGHPLLRRR
jgi:hypothetical protein